jgi:Ca2+-binding EF-hand superfamily protein
MAFLEIDDWGYGYIDQKNLKNFLRKHGYLANESELMAIIRRMDLDGDARIGKEEFIQGLMPDQPYSKS